MANGFVQGCPACPGLVNILFEPFHRRAAAQKKKVLLLRTLFRGCYIGCGFFEGSAVPRTRLPGIMRLPSNQAQWEEYATLVQPKRHWVSRQGEIWRGRGALTTWATFQVVGIELGAKERVTSLAHFAPRLQNFLNLENRVFLSWKSVLLKCGTRRSWRRVSMSARFQKYPMNCSDLCVRNKILTVLLGCVGTTLIGSAR